MKTCNDCQEVKELSDFKVRKSGSLYAKCKSCCHLDDVRWRNNNRDKYRDGQLKSKFGITLVTYNEMLQQQNNCCAACKRDRSEFKQNFAVDHCHDTLKIRGLLCDGCNKAIGYLYDNPEFADGVAAYLRRQNAL